MDNNNLELFEHDPLIITDSEGSDPDSTGYEADAEPADPLVEAVHIAAMDGNDVEGGYLSGGFSPRRGSYHLWQDDSDPSPDDYIQADYQYDDDDQAVRPYQGPQTHLQAIHSRNAPMPARPPVKLKLQLPVPMGVIPDLDLPPIEDQSVRGSALSSLMYDHIIRDEPLPDELLVGYHSSDGEAVTESRRFYVTEHYREMMWAELGSGEDENHRRRSARLQRAREVDTPSTSKGTDRNEGPWYDRPRPTDEDSS